MSAWIRTINQKMKWINIVCLLLIGLFWVARGFTLPKDNSGHQSGVLLVISGSLWGLSGAFEWYSSSLNDVGRIVCYVVEIIMVISAIVLIAIA